MPLFPLETERLWIRYWQPSQDAAQAYEIYSDPRVTQWIGDKTTAQTIEDVRDRLQRYCDRFYKAAEGTGCWAVVEKDTEQIIGNVLLVRLPDGHGNPCEDREIGWHFRPASWGYGYATEAARRIVDYGFQTLNLAELYAVAMVGNQRSTRVMKRLGMATLGITTNYYSGAELLLYRLRAPQH